VNVPTVFLVLAVTAVLIAGVRQSARSNTWLRFVVWLALGLVI
jgi:hypothetical protein